MDASAPSDIPVVLITGFGPFHSVLVNPSWEVAKALKTYLEWTRPVHIIIEQMSVTYEDVNTKIPEFWLKYNPTVSPLRQITAQETRRSFVARHPHRRRRGNESDPHRTLRLQ